MIAWKFLRPGAVAPFSRRRWPAGAWVRADGADERRCRAGVHACEVDQLPFWLAEELWLVELEEPVQRSTTKLVAPAGRLVQRVRAWDGQAAADFAAAALERVREIDTAGFVADAEVHCGPAATARDPFGAAAVSTAIAVEAAERAGGGAAVAAERARQGAWLAARLGAGRS